MLKRTLALGLAALALAGPTAASAQAVAIAPMAGDTRIDTVVTQNLTGKCGAAVVRVMGVTYIGDTFSTDLDAAQVIVRHGDPYREVVIKNFLSDHNGIACVGPEGAETVLIWSNCGGTACGDEFTFQVIDPRRIAVIAGEIGGKPCDARCAASVTSSVVPLRINGLLD